MQRVLFYTVGEWRQQDYRCPHLSFVHLKPLGNMTSCLKQPCMQRQIYMTSCASSFCTGISHAGRQGSVIHSAFKLFATRICLWVMAGQKKHTAGEWFCTWSVELSYRSEASPGPCKKRFAEALTLVFSQGHIVRTSSFSPQNFSLVCYLRAKMWILLDNWA